MKKEYKTPRMFVQFVQAEQMLAASGPKATITDEEWDGDAGAKSSNFFGESIFDE